MLTESRPCPYMESTARRRQQQPTRSDQQHRFRKELRVTQHSRQDVSVAVHEQPIECILEDDPIGLVCCNTRSALCLGPPGQAWDKTF